VSLEWGKIVKSINWTLVFNLINFAILLYLLKRLLFKPALEYLDRRRELIAGRMNSALESEKRAGELVAKREEELAAARARSTKIVDEARIRSAEMVGEAKEKAKSEADRIVREARIRMEQERDRMIDELKEAYADIAILAAERVLDREIKIEDHRRLLDQLLSEIGDDALRVGP